MSSQPGPAPAGDRAAAQRDADRLRLLRHELAGAELQAILQLTPEQSARFDQWSRARLDALAEKFDIDTTASQKRASWGMRIASTIGGMALCAALVLLLMRYWGYLTTPAQVTLVTAAPVLLVAATEFVSRRETAKYFTGLLSLVALASFIMNLAAVGNIFNVVSTERALLAWGAFALALAYRHGLRLMLALGLILLEWYLAAAFAALGRHHWTEVRAESFLAIGFLVFALPLLRRIGPSDFPAVCRLTGALTFFIALHLLADWGAPSYLPWETANVQRFYGIAGLAVSAGAIWWGIAGNWNGVVNTGAIFFLILLLSRLYHWWWDWMPRYLFFALIGGLGIALVWAFKRIRGAMSREETEALP